jgi:uncharacterized membrane protein
MQVMGVQYSYSGPLPPPEVLEHFERIVPGGAARIFTQFESQTAHRQLIEKRVINSNSFVQIFGSVSALLLGLLAIGGGLYLVHEGKSLEGFGAFFTCLASLVGVYVIGKRAQARERKTKQGS